MNEMQSIEQAHVPALDLPITLDGPMPTALALYLNTALYERVKAVAVIMSKAEGVTPRHLLGKPEACFAVVSRAITWRLDPYAVAMSTYQTPGGQMGFEGKLIHAIIENSGRLTRGIQYDHYGDWSKIRGRFEIKVSEKGNKYAVPKWTDEDARAGGCGVKVSAQVKGETQPRTMNFDLIQAQPRNSTLWATDPQTQICYTAVRRFGSLVAPSLLMGVPFDPSDSFEREPIDITHASRVDDGVADINEEIKATPVRPAAQAPATESPKPAPAAAPEPTRPPPVQTMPKAQAEAQPRAQEPAQAAATGANDLAGGYTYPVVREALEKAIQARDLQKLADMQALVGTLPTIFHAELNKLANEGRKTIEAIESAARGER